ncbi:MAG: Na/Pi cotransporter family protein [Clostridiales bacterium]|jgi:phosphate:Na+ symporter|nr:Na/Pi cotransporter family protein [Clostridiales bacterium]
MTGMKTLSDGLEHGAGKGIQRLLGKISGNRFAGFGVGTAVTGIIQSSSATTVMVIGFVNAGIMTLMQAAAIIIGANVGTTVTAFMSALSAFKITEYLVAFTFIGIFIIMFSKKEKVILIGRIMSGLGMIFVGLDLMGNAFKSDPTVNEAIRGLFDSSGLFSSNDLFGSIGYSLLLVLFGVIFTGIIQSSSAFISIVISMIGARVLPLEYALFIVLGSNIGTCVTALIASIGTTVNAKRAAVMHLLFNVTGTLAFVAVLLILKNPVVDILQRAIPTEEFRVAVFHLIFNLITAGLVLPFTKQLVVLSERLIPDKKDAVGVGRRKLRYIDDRLLTTPPAAVLQLKKEVKGMSDLARENLKRGITALLTRAVSDKDKILKDEETINFINKGVAAFLIKLSSVSTAKSEELFIGSLHHVISDVERIGDYAQNFIEEAEKIIEKRVIFSDAALKEINAMYEKVLVMYDAAIDILISGDIKKLSFVARVEDEVDEMKRTFGDNHVGRLNEGGCSVESGAYFYAVISGLERVADHLTNIAFSIKSPSGSQREAMEILAGEKKI